MCGPVNRCRRTADTDNPNNDFRLQTHTLVANVTTTDKDQLFMTQQLSRKLMTYAPDHKCV